MDPAQVKSLVTYPHEGTLYSLATEPAGSRLFVGSSDYRVHLFDRAREQTEPVAAWEGHDNYVSALAWLDCGGAKLAISGSFDRSLIWRSAESGETIRALTAHDGWVRDIATLPSGAGFVSVGDDMLVKLWDAATGQLVRSLAGHAVRTPQGHVTALYAAAVSPDGRFIASGDRIGEVRVWEAETGMPAAVFQVPTLYTYDPKQRKRSIGGIRSLAFSPDGSRVAVGGIGQIENVDGLAGPIHVEVWDWQAGKALAIAGAEGKQGIVNHLLFASGGEWLIGGGGGSDNGFLTFWKLDPLPAPSQDSPDTPPTVTATRFETDGHIHRLVLSADEREIYAAGHGKLEVWSSS